MTNTPSHRGTGTYHGLLRLPDDGTRHGQVADPKNAQALIPGEQAYGCRGEETGQTQETLARYHTGNTKPLGGRTGSVAVSRAENGGVENQADPTVKSTTSETAP